jgi:hypothetical protein
MANAALPELESPRRRDEEVEKVTVEAWARWSGVNTVASVHELDGALGGESVVAAAVERGERGRSGRSE